MLSNKNLEVRQFNQIINYSCMPACLQQVFNYYKKSISQKEILNSLKIPGRGMSIPRAGMYTIERGFNPIIVSNNIYIFDPAWFDLNKTELIKKLVKRKRFIDEYGQSVISDYLAYLKAGGKIEFNTVCSDLIKKYLIQGKPIVIELASNYLYKKSKSSKQGKFDDPVRGKIDGHGVVVAGFSKSKFKIIDPDSKSNPYSKNGIYWVIEEDLIMSFSVLNGKSLLII